LGIFAAADATRRHPRFVDQAEAASAGLFANRTAATIQPQSFANVI
jgi:hypothetical protein